MCHLLPECQRYEEEDRMDWYRAGRGRGNNRVTHTHTHYKQDLYITMPTFPDGSVAAAPLSPHAHTTTALQDNSINRYMNTSRE